MKFLNYLLDLLAKSVLISIPVFMLFMLWRLVYIKYPIWSQWIMNDMLTSTGFWMTVFIIAFVLSWKRIMQRKPTEVNKTDG